MIIPLSSICLNEFRLCRLATQIEIELILSHTEQSSDTLSFSPTAEILSRGACEAWLNIDWVKLREITGLSTRRGDYDVMQVKLNTFFLSLSLLNLLLFSYEHRLYGQIKSNFPFCFFTTVHRDVCVLFRVQHAKILLYMWISWIRW